MKKLVALILAVVLGLVGAIMPTSTVAAETATCPADAAEAQVWAGYKARCRHYKPAKKTHTRHISRVALALLMPMLLTVGPIGSGPAANKFTVSCLWKGKIVSKDFNRVVDAIAAYNKLRDKNIPRRLINSSAKVPVILADAGWTSNISKIENIQEWREEARELLHAARIDKAKTEKILGLGVDNLKQVVFSYNVEALTALDGIGEKTAYKAVRALKQICRQTTTIRSYESKEFTRLTLKHELGSDEYFVADKIRKGVTPVEAKAIALGGNDAIITVVSKLDNVNVNNIEEAEQLEETIWYWKAVCQNGILYNGTKYVFLGHGTNAAKECKTLWVEESIYAEMRKWILKGSNPNWKTTVAKKLAYLVGLQNVTRKSTGIPFMPEDFVVYPSVYSDIKGNHFKEFLDGHEEFLKGNKEPVNRSDGYFIIDIPEQMYPEYINRMVSQGVDPEEAEERLRAFVADTSVNSYRCNGIALKGCGDKHVAFHSFAYANGITHAPDGAHLNTKSVFIDETVLKTAIGPDGAYETFQDWADAVRDELDLGVCVKAHKRSRKNVSYQVIQALCEASGKTVRDMAKSTIDRVNKAHYVDGASRLLGRELGHISKIFPSIMKERNVAERVAKKLQKLINDAFSGELIDESYYAFITPDPILVMQGWLGLELTGCLKAGECNVGGFDKGELAFWKFPVMHPNSMRVYNNVKIPKEFRKYFKSNEFVIIMNSIDDVSVAVAADWDGDHGSISESKPLIEAIKQTQAKWGNLIIWETPHTPKGVVKRADELMYVGDLTHANELGLTVFGFNALLNRVKKIKDDFGRIIDYIVIEIPRRGVNFKVFAGNVLVDAGKHGGGTIVEPSESAQSADMVQPWAKQYRDAVKRHENWRVSWTGFTKFFETEAEARHFASENKRMKPCVVNHLDELATLKNKDMDHTAGTLNKLFALYATYMDRSTKIYDLPNGSFDFHQLMFNPEESRRGISGLIRYGNKPVEYIDGRSFRPDEGLFNAIAGRMAQDRAVYYNDSSVSLNHESGDFEQDWRCSALAEIRDFAESYGKTLEDAYDVVTWQMFAYIDKQYATMDGKLDFIRDNLWQAYWLIFGGMAEEAAMRFEEIDDNED